MIFFKLNQKEHLTLFIFISMLIASILVFLPLASVQANTADSAIGKVIKLDGKASASTATDEKRNLRVGSSIFEKDTVVTEKKSSVTILFNDKTRFEIGPEATLVASEFKYNKKVDEDSVAIRVLKGSFRFITGLVAKNKPEAMEVNTAVATIGIRGTNVVGEANSTSATIILIEPEDSSRKTAIEVSNKFGSVTIDEPGYGTEIPDEYSPPSLPRRMRLQTINNIMRSMQNVNRVNMPRPRMP
ncbi:MAG: FecR domain-containing protein [Proteobacteria bacterium]|nr:hypothetical protein [Pseudomonadota bacterium]NOG59689.1 FecR domain-containing protein [Pseudomonadota bacterium]